MGIVALVAFAGVVVFGVLFMLMALKEKSLKIPGIGMVVCFLVIVALSAMKVLMIGPYGEPVADGSQTGDSSHSFIEVDPGLFSVTLTIPADYVDEGMTQEQLNEIVKEEGYKSATLNDDGSVTYIITKAQHRKIMDGIKQGIDEGISEIVNSEDNQSIVRIDKNSDYTQYKIYLNTEEVGISESFTAFGLCIYSGMYHAFNGTDPGNVNIQFINEATGEIIEESNSSDIQ